MRVTEPGLLLKADELPNAGGLLKQAVREVEEAMEKARTRHPVWCRGPYWCAVQAIGHRNLLARLELRTGRRLAPTDPHKPSSHDIERAPGEAASKAPRYRMR